jgi:Ca2+-binding EF-hand superfamily protein
MYALVRTLALSAILLGVPPATAQQAPNAEALLAQSITAGLTFERYLELRRMEFTRFDADGNGFLSLADIEVDHARTAAASRAGIVSTFLQADLDGDGAVTADEISQSMEGMITMLPIVDSRKEVGAAIAKHMAADTNGDGRVDGAEMVAAAKQQVSARPLPRNDRFSAMLTLDEDRDGRTSEEEFLKGAESAFRKVDADGDGTASREEVSALKQRN